MSIPAAAALLLTLPIITVSAEQPYCHDFTAGPCISGCWNAAAPVSIINWNLFNSLRQCEPVGTGYSSPSLNDARIMCQAGTYSSSSVAGICDECPKGTYSANDGASECTPCPINSYNRFRGSDSCTECNGAFSGVGSNAVRRVPMQDGTFETFCVGGGEPVALVPTASLTVSTTQPSVSLSDMPSMIPSMQPTQGKPASLVLTLIPAQHTPAYLEKKMQNLTHYNFAHPLRR
jgi:hypothetical protein